MTRQKPRARREEGTQATSLAGPVAGRGCGPTVGADAASAVSDALTNIRIGTMVKGNAPDPAGYVRHILDHGFESIEPFFWQTIGNKDLPRLAGELKEAIGDRDVTISTLGMFGNPLEGGDLDRQTLAGWGDADRLCPSLRRDLRRRLHGTHPRQADRGEPAALHGGVWTRLAKRAADKGVRIAFENCAMDGNWATGDWNIAHNPDAWELMFDALPDDNLGLEWEPCHQLVYLIDPIPQIRKWARKFFHVHGKDATIRWDVIREHGIFGNRSCRCARPDSATATGRGSSANCASPATRARSTSRAGTTRSTATRSR